MQNKLAASRSRDRMRGGYTKAKAWLSSRFSRFSRATGLSVASNPRSWQTAPRYDPALYGARPVVQPFAERARATRTAAASGLRELRDPDHRAEHAPRRAGVRGAEARDRRRP